jgi:Serine aminopeptidase, S33
VATYDDHGRQPMYSSTHSLVGCALVWLLLGLHGRAFASETRPSESEQVSEYVCTHEKFVFSMLVKAAGQPAVGYVPSGSVSLLSHIAADGVTLRGFKATAASSEAGTDRSAILLVQGNAVLADQIIEQLQEISAHGYDAFVYDFRGYGRSADSPDAVPSMKKIVSDYDEILQALYSMSSESHRTYTNIFVYAMSTGGVFALNAGALATVAKGVALDSVPATVNRAWHLFWVFPVFSISCPESMQPINRLPTNMKPYLWYQGERDDSVRANDKTQKAALAIAEGRGATVIRDTEAGHVFMDGRTTERIRVVTEFFDHLRATGTLPVGGSTTHVTPEPNRQGG